MLLSRRHADAAGGAWFCGGFAADGEVAFVEDCLTTGLRTQSYQWMATERGVIDDDGGSHGAHPHQMMSYARHHCSTCS